MPEEEIAIESLKLDPKNARSHDDRNILAIVSSLSRFGQVKPVVIDKTGVVRAGNGVVIAARKLGWKTVKAVRVDLPESELTAFAIADNRTAELSEWDAEALFDSLEALKIENIFPDDIGFSDEDLAAILGPMADAIDGDVEESAESSGDGSGSGRGYVCQIECRDENEKDDVTNWAASSGYRCKVLESGAD